MKQSFVAVTVSIAAIVLCAVGWFLLPSLQGASQAGVSQTSLHVERARRLLHQYQFSLTYQSALLDQLADAGTDVHLEDLDELVEIEDFADRYQEDHAVRWESYRPTDWSVDPPRVAKKASYGNLNRQIREGVQAREALAKANESLLDEALAEVERGLSPPTGGPGAVSGAEALRLKGVILYQKGLRERLRGSVRRMRAEPYRRRLMDIALRGLTYQSKEELARGDVMDEAMEDLHDRITDQEREIQEGRDRLSALDSTIQKLQQRRSAAQSRGDAARTAMDELRKKGIDLTDSHGAADFETRYRELDQTARQAEREVLSVTAGDYPDARIDQSGDYLKGKYIQDSSSVQLRVELGLNHYQGERHTVEVHLIGLIQARDDLRADLGRLESVKTNRQREGRLAHKWGNDARTSAAKVFDELRRVESEASAIEESALALFQASARASQAAARLASDWVRDARSRTQDISPEARGRSAYNSRLQDGWMGGHIAAQQADAYLQRAYIDHAQYIAAAGTAGILDQTAEMLKLKEADVGAYAQKANDARKAGLEDITQAMRLLKKAYGGANQHWTFVAQQATAYDLLALFGESDYTQDAVEAYRGAVKGREKEAFVQAYLTRLQHLENR